MLSRILTRLAVVWAVILWSWALILAHNVPGVMAHGGWGAVAFAAFLPLALALALAWVFAPRR